MELLLIVFLVADTFREISRFFTGNNDFLAKSWPLAFLLLIYSVIPVLFCFSVPAVWTGTPLITGDIL